MYTHRAVASAGKVQHFVLLSPSGNARDNGFARAAALLKHRESEFFLTSMLFLQILLGPPTVSG